MAFDAETGRVYLVTAQFGPAPAPHRSDAAPASQLLPDTFEIIVVEK